MSIRHHQIIYLLVAVSALPAVLGWALLAATYHRPSLLLGAGLLGLLPVLLFGWSVAGEEDEEEER
jgi:hypothetical protein